MQMAFYPLISVGRTLF